MKKVESLDEINRWIASFMKKGVLSNNYIMSDKYRSWIESGSLYYSLWEGALIFFLDCGSYRRVYYHIKDGGVPIELPEDKPLAMELVYRSGSSSSGNSLDFWKTKGFKPYIYRLRMNCSAKALRNTGMEANHVTYAGSRHAAAIQEMISSEFDPYLGCVPSLLEVEQYIKQEEIITVPDERGGVAGVLHIGGKGATCFIWHLVVSPRERNKGVAKKLLAQLGLLLQETDNAKIQLWVKRDNLSARGLYEKAGFEYDGWESTGLIAYPG